MVQNNFTEIDIKRKVFCNRTLNLKSIRAIGYDMDYTLIHYKVTEWETAAYEHLQKKLHEKYNLPVEILVFDPSLVMQGLVIDIELGNLVKANRFGFIKIASHGTSMLTYEEQRKIYTRDLVDLSIDRYQFLNTKFSISEACMYAQLVDMVDAGELPKGMSYARLYRIVRRTIHEAHIEGFLKGEILKTPERFVQLDKEMPLALLDQKMAGKKLLLITNSEWSYTLNMMNYAVNPFLPDGMTWRELFDLVIVSSGKPAFFQYKLPMFEIVDEPGLLKPVVGGLKDGGCYLGGCATMVEDYYGFDGNEFLYVGAHIFADVHVSKSILRWRTGLIVRELDEELDALQKFYHKQTALTALMSEKATVERRLVWGRLQLQRLKADKKKAGNQKKISSLFKKSEEIRQRLEALDTTISPLAEEFNTLMNKRWGLLMRVGNEKSHFARQVEQYSDIYMSKVSNFLYTTPFAYLRAPHSNLPHDLRKG